MTIMSSAKMMIIFLLLTIALFDPTTAAHYQVGGDAGWSAGKFDYRFWAFGHHFKVGDYLDFKYASQLHNVMEVSKQDFESCNSNSPLLTYTTGHDSVELTTGGHHYFICGIPGHCDMGGQKVDIFVLGGHNDTGGGNSDGGGGGSPNISPPYNHNSASLLIIPNFLSFKWLYLIALTFFVGLL